MKKALIVIDMQKDFVDGALANVDAQAIVTPIAERVLRYDGDIIATRDTHGENYLSSPEGKKLPVPHCIQGTDGWEIVTEIAAALEKRKALVLDKPTFGYLGWDCLADYDEVEMVGTCTDICVVSNALRLNLINVHDSKKDKLKKSKKRKGRSAFNAYLPLLFACFH